MFRYITLEENLCDTCSETAAGSMVYMGGIPVCFICSSCNPTARSSAMRLAYWRNTEDEMNGWEWPDSAALAASHKTL